MDECGDNVFHWAARYTNAVFLQKMIKIIKQVNQLIQYDEDGVEIPASPRSPKSLNSRDEATIASGSGGLSIQKEAKKKMGKGKKNKGLLKHEDELRMIVNAKNLKGKTPSEIAKSSFISAYVDKYIQPIIAKSKSGNKVGISTKSPSSMPSSPANAESLS